jgi:hypothetical protein
MSKKIDQKSSAVKQFKEISEEVIGEIWRAPYTGEEGDRYRYMSFRFLGFSMIESCKLAHIAHSQVQEWYREDKYFHDLDKYKLPKLKQQESMNWITDIWEQNFQLLAARDRWVFEKAYLSPEGLTQEEKKWLEVRQRAYSPESLARLRVTKSMVQGPKLGSQISFQELVMSMKKNEEVRLKMGIEESHTEEPQEEPQDFDLIEESEDEG